MADDGLKTGQLPEVELIDDLLGNRDGSASRISTDKLAAQLAETGAMAEKFSEYEEGVDQSLSEAQQILAQLELIKIYIGSAVVPIGNMTFHYFDEVPDGWLLVNGQPVTPDMPDLRQKLIDDGAPLDENGDPLLSDPRGRVVRIWDPDGNLDPEVARAIRSFQGDALQDHGHTYTGTVANDGSGQSSRSYMIFDDSGGVVSDVPVSTAIDDSGEARISTETRMANAAYPMIIKAYHAYANLAGRIVPLGTAAEEDVEAFATAAQGAKADTAVQPEDIGTAAEADAGAFTPAPVWDPTLYNGVLLDLAIFGSDGALLFGTGVNGELFNTSMASDADLAAAQAQIDALRREADTAVAVPTWDPVLLPTGQLMTTATFGTTGQLLGGTTAAGEVLPDGSIVTYDPVVVQGRVLAEATFSLDGVLQRGAYEDGSPVRAAYVAAKDPILPTVPRWSRPANTIVGAPSFGQSLNVGRGGFPFSGLRNLDPKRILMPDFGATAGEWDNYFEPIRRLVPYRPSASEAANPHGEHGMQGILHQLALHNDGQNILVGCALGRGGTSMSDLLSATHWDQVTSYATQMTALAASMGMNFEIGVFPVMHGSADDGDVTAAEYAALLDQLDTQVQALTAITGQDGGIPILIDQVSALPSGAADSVAMGQILAARNNPNIYLSGGRPDAAFRYSDGTHGDDGTQYIYLGERAGICASRLMAGAVCEPIWIKEVKVTGAVAVLTYPDQHGDLVLDYDRGQPKNASAGYEAEDNTGSLTITSVSVDRNKVTLVFNRAVTTGLMIRNAWDAAVGRTATALRNQQVELSQVDGSRLYFWGVTEEYDVDARALADTLNTLDPQANLDASDFDGTVWPSGATDGFNGVLADFDDGPFDGLARPTLTATDATLNNLPTVAFPGELASPAFDASADVYLVALLKPKSGTTGTVLEMRDASGDGFHIYVDDTAGELRIQVQNNTPRTITATLDAWVLFSVQILWRQMDPYLRIQLYGAAETVYELTTPMAAVDDAVLTLGAPHPSSTGGQAGSADFDLSDLIFGPGETNYLLVDGLFDHIAAKADL